MTPVGSRATAQNSSPRFPPHRVTARSDLFRRRRGGLRLRNLRFGRCFGAGHRLLPLCVLLRTRSLSAGAWVSCHPVFFNICRVCLRAVGNQSPNLGRKLLYSSLSFSLGLRGIGRLALRLNYPVICYGLFLFGHCFLSFIHCFLLLN